MGNDVSENVVELFYDVDESYGNFGISRMPSHFESKDRPPLGPTVSPHSVMRTPSGGDLGDVSICEGDQIDTFVGEGSVN